MRKPRRRRSKAIVILPIVFLLIAGAAFGFLMFSKELSKPKGVVTYDSSLTDAEKALAEGALTDFIPVNDVTISASLEDAAYIDKPGNYLVYQTLVPTTDFYSPVFDITSDELEKYTLTPVEELEPTTKLLSLDGKYYLDDLKEGAKYRVIHFESKTPDETKDKVATKIEKTGLEKDGVLRFSQTGVAALTRRMLNKLAEVGSGAYFAEYIKDYLSASDLTHISNEVSFASDCSIKDMTLCADPRMFDAISAIGTDIVELTGNHNNDWGKTANIETIKLYHEKDIKTFGGGETEEDAAKPLEISEKGNNITLIGINNSTSSKTNGQGADGNNPGANIYDEALTEKQIKEAKDKGNFVIVDIQFAECYSYPDEGQEMPECDLPITGQQAFFRQLIDEGANMIIGTQAHQPQTYEIYQGKPIYYGLGNLFFDQTYWPGTERSLVLTHYFKDGKLLQTRILPTMYGTSYQPQFLDNTAKQSYLERLLSTSPKGA